MYCLLYWSCHILKLTQYKKPKTTYKCLNLQKKEGSIKGKRYIINKKITEMTRHEEIKWSEKSRVSTECICRVKINEAESVKSGKIVGNLPCGTLFDIYTLIVYGRNPSTGGTDTPNADGSFLGGLQPGQKENTLNLEE